MVNYVTPGYATAVFDSVQGLQRVRTTAESHRRIGIVEVMGRHSGYIALGTAYGQPDIILVPEVPVRIPALVERVRELYELQKNVVIVCGEGIVGEDGRELGAKRESFLKRWWVMQAPTGHRFCVVGQQAAKERVAQNAWGRRK